MDPQSSEEGAILKVLKGILPIYSCRRRSYLFIHSLLLQMSPSTEQEEYCQTFLYSSLHGAFNTVLQEKTVVTSYDIVLHLENALPRELQLDKLGA